MRQQGFNMRQQGFNIRQQGFTWYNMDLYEKIKFMWDNKNLFNANEFISKLNKFYKLVIISKYI